MQVYTYYENYRGGINNLQISSVVIGYSTVKVFRSIEHAAHVKAQRFIDKQILKIEL
jgi:hypothetical protein